MNMNILTNHENKLISVENYFNLLAKKSKLEVIEEVQMNEMKRYLTYCFELEKKGILPESALPSLAKYREKINALQEKEAEDLTRLESLEVENYQQSFHNQEDENYKRTLHQKSGYVDAIIILAALLNVGFIIAMTILGNR